MKKFLTVALAGVLAASMLFTGCSKKEESKVPDKLIVGTNAEFPPVLLCLYHGREHFGKCT